MISPRTQSLVSQQEQTASAKELFDSAFQEMALNKFMSRKPDMAQLIASFKLLDSSPETNSATGSIVLSYEGDELHVPAILTDSELMPFDTMYVKSLDMMLPLNDDWVQEVARLNSSNMGGPANAPPFSQNDVDIRNVVVPPTTGRYSYASHGRNLPAYLAGAPNRVKRSFVATLEKYPHIAKYAFSVYDVNDLTAAVRPHRTKRASATDTLTATFVTIESPTKDIVSLFGGATPNAMRSIAEKGYAYKDDRVAAPIVVSEEQPLTLSVPDMPGFYYVYTNTGERKAALVLTNVLNVADYCSTASVHDSLRSRGYRVALFEDGSATCTKRDFLGSPLGIQNVPDRLRQLISRREGDAPTQGQKGMFFNVDGGSISAMAPMTIRSVMRRPTDRRYEASDYGGADYVLTQIAGSPIKRPVSMNDATSESSSWKYSPMVRSGGTTTTNRVLLPVSWKFLPISDLKEETYLLTNPRAITAHVFNGLKDTGAERIEVKSAGFNEFHVDNKAMSKTAAVRYMAVVRGLRVPDAESLIKMALAKGHGRAVSALVVPPVGIYAGLKIAQDPAMMDPSQMDPSQMDPSMMDPSQMDPSQMDPSMMDPSMMDPSMMGPPPPSAVELAAQEVADSLMQGHQDLMQQMQQQQQNLQTQMQAINAVTQRAHQISQEMGMAPPALPPDLIDPMFMAQPEDQAYMDDGAPVEEQGAAIEEPQSAEAAMQLEDPELFDASMIGSLATEDGIDESVSTYTPALRDALDGVGRMLTEVRMKANPLRERVGDKAYNDIRDKLESLFKSMGDTLTTMNSVITE